jgi:hypothetical protein
MTKPISGVAPLCGKALIMALRGAKFGTIDEQASSRISSHLVASRCISSHLHTARGDIR